MLHLNTKVNSLFSAIQVKSDLSIAVTIPVVAKDT